MVSVKMRAAPPATDTDDVALRHARQMCGGPHGCEVDHLISLELGGANAIENLWPQPFDGKWNAHVKDRLELRLHKEHHAPNL